VTRWTTPADVRVHAEKLWDSGRMLRARLAGENLFPAVVPLSRPRSPDVAARWNDVNGWLHALDAGSARGYVVSWKMVAYRTVGRNRMAHQLVIPTEAAALELADRAARASQVFALADATVSEFPELRPLFVARPRMLLKHAADWERVLAVLRWIRAHPRSGIYLRQMTAPGIHSKFVESRRKLFSRVLDQLYPDDRGTALEARLGFRSKPARIRFRALDARLAIAGLTDVTARVDELSRMPIDARWIFVTENQINGLAFPEVAGGVVFFGLGYGIENLARIEWVRCRTLYYWGDIDTHGFSILAKLRGLHPEVRSILMDRATLESHRPFWGEEPPERRCLVALDRLTEPEALLFEDLRSDRLAPRLRLEQEHVPYDYVLSTITALQRS
jgi:hypothetical protein